MGRRGGPPPPPPPPGACPASLPPPPFLSSSSFSLSAGAAGRRGSREEVGVLTTSGRTREGTCLCLPPLLLDVCVHTPPPPFGAAAAQVCGEEGDGDATDGGGQLLPAPSRCELLSFFFLPADSLLQNESCLWRHGEEEDGPHSAARRSKSVPPLSSYSTNRPTDRRLFQCPETTSCSLCASLRERGARIPMCCTVVSAQRKKEAWAKTFARKGGGSCYCRAKK